MSYSTATLCMLEMGIDRMESHEHLLMLKAMDFPYMKDPVREKYQHKLKELAYPVKKKALTTEEFARSLREKFG